MIGKQLLLTAARCTAPRSILENAGLPNRCESHPICDTEWDIVPSPCALKKNVVVEVNRDVVEEKARVAAVQKNAFQRVEDKRAGDTEAKCVRKGHLS